MKIIYDEDADALYIRLTDKETDESFDVGDGVILHMDYWGGICGMEWENASEEVDLSRLDVSGLPQEPGSGGGPGRGDTREPPT